jgi:hypothetical protein
MSQTVPDALMEGTIAIPLTPEISALIARDAVRQVRSVMIAVACIIVAGQLLGPGIFSAVRFFRTSPPENLGRSGFTLLGRG